MNRILFEKEELSGGRATFSDGRAEHVLNVLHGTVGQVLKTGEIDGLVGTSVITEIRDLHEREEGSAQRGSGLLAGTVTVECSHTERAAEPWFDLLLAPPRPRVLKRLLPQLAALGVGKIVLVGAEKVEKAFWGAQLLKEEIYRPLLIEGLMQCGTVRMPTIRCERNFRRYAETQMEDEFAGCGKIVAHPQPSTLSPPSPRLRRTGPQLSTLLRQGYGGQALNPQPSTQRCVLAVGPEGGWTDGEVEMLECKGFRRYSLGGRILRTDTAAIAAIAQLMAVWS